ncbi:Protein transport protein sec20 [Sporothrix stenoceras]|uniref:Protein transport protein sec20 n=1 Tax=Sporothrix stenoceras TaxID=5173 RepID=A0ABR3Z8H6_9PEZI
MASLEELHDRLGKAQDILVDLRQMIDRLAGNSSANAKDHRRSSSTSSLPSYTPATTTPTAPDDLFFYLDKEATDDLVNEITDTLRDAQDDFDLLREDAVDLGVIAADPSAHATADHHDEPADPHAISSVNRTLRPFGASLRSSSAHSGGSGGVSSSFTEDESASGSIDSHRLQRGVTRLGEGLAEARKAFRAAQLAAHRNREAAQREQHRQVLASYIEEEESEEEVEDDVAEKTVRAPSRTRMPPLAKHASPTTSAAADVTAALRQTHARIAGEVARSDFAAQTLAESSRALAELGDKYGGGGSTSAGGGGDIGSSLKSARTLVKGLVAAHKSDTWYLQTALYIVVATIGWLLFRRLLYGPLWLLVWWPLRTVFGTAAWVGKTGASVAGAKQGVSSISESPLASVVPSIATTSVAAEVHATESAPSQATPSGSLIAEVSRIIEESATASSAVPTGEPGSASEEAVQPNPKKRMWEEPVEAAKHEAQQQKVQEEKEKAEQEKAEQEGKGKGKEPAEGEHKKDEL